MSRYIDFAYKSIKELVEDGLKLLTSITDVTFYGSAGYSNPMFAYSNNEFQRWSDYSQKILELSTKEVDSSIYLNYLRLLMSLQINHTMSSKDKVKACLDYLIEVLEVLSKRY